MASSSTSLLPTLFLILLLALLLLHCTDAQPPSPRYFPSKKLRSIPFGEGYSNLWGPEHQSLSQDQSALTIWLDKSSGSGFKSIKSYRNGYFGASVKLQAGYTAGVNTAFYLSNNQQYPGYHDEIDIEFLGTIPGEPYTLQTNVYVRGSGDGKLVGREMRFHLWFDPTADYHHYAVLWNPDEIIFYVDDIPIRRYENKVDGTYPNREMWMYGSIWDASDWATDNGKYRADYQYQPFVAHFTNFKIGGCTTDSPASCHPVPASHYGSALSEPQYQAMLWAQKTSMIYYYCQDSSKDRSLYPEC